MNELFELSFTGPNILPTALLLFVGFYWVVFLIGLIDLSFLDFDLDLDKDLGIEIDVDAEVDMDVDADADSSGGSWGLGLLRFLNLDAVPFMVFTSFFALFFWGGSVVGHAVFDSAGILVTLAVTLGAVVLAALLTKAITQPFRRLFASLNEEERPIEFRGRICVLELGVTGDRLGQAELTVDGKNILLNVLSETGEAIASRTQCVIVDHRAERDAYTVHPFNPD